MKIYVCDCCKNEKKPQDLNDPDWNLCDDCTDNIRETFKERPVVTPANESR